MAREFSTIGVVGLGTMGAGIAEVFARNGFAVVGVEPGEEQLIRGRAHVERSTGRAKARGRLSGEEQQAILDRISFTTTMADLKDCQLIVEAVVERLDLKRSVFQQLDEIVNDDAVLATNTSSLSVTEIAAGTSNPARVVGMHFFNPAPVQRLVEVIHTVVTEPGTVDDVRRLAEALGKNPVTVGDRAGFIANALLFGYLNRAASMYESRHATREDIDAAMRIACRYPMGPLALLDLIGLDTAYEILTTMYHQGGNRLHAPSPLLGQLVTAGLLGRKTGRGFYTYAGPGSAAVVDDRDTPSGAVPTDVRPVRSVGVVGSGPTAGGIAQALTHVGYDVTHVSWQPGDAADGVEANLARVAEVDLVVEAVGDDRAVKVALFKMLDAQCRDGVVLATTGSSLQPVIELAAVTSRAKDVVGLHLVRPAEGTRAGPDSAPLGADVVEVVSTVATDSDAAARVRGVCLALGKQPVSCSDRTGFIVDGLLYPYLNDATRMLETRYATADDIDTAMKDGCALPMGPFEVLDDVGLDVALAAQRALFDEVPEPGLAPVPLLEHLVTAGYLGRTSGRGFRVHSDG